MQSAFSKRFVLFRWHAILAVHDEPNETMMAFGHHVKNGDGKMPFFFPERNRPQASDIIDRMKEVTNTSTDAELASAISVNKTTVASWRKRNQVPLDHILLASQKYLTSIEYVVYGDSAGRGTLTHGVDNDHAYGIVMYFYERCREHILYGDKYNTCLWWGRIFPRAVQYYENEIHSLSVTKEISTEEAMEMVRAAIDALEPGDFIPKLNNWFRGRD